MGRIRLRLDPLGIGPKRIAPRQMIRKKFKFLGALTLGSAARRKANPAI
jgi:hypothetical protein